MDCVADFSWDIWRRIFLLSQPVFHILIFLARLFYVIYFRGERRKSSAWDLRKAWPLVLDIKNDDSVWVLSSSQGRKDLVILSVVFLGTSFSLQRRHIHRFESCDQASLQAKDDHCGYRSEQWWLQRLRQASCQDNPLLTATQSHHGKQKEFEIYLLASKFLQKLFLHLYSVQLCEFRCFLFFAFAAFFYAQSVPFMSLNGNSGFSQGIFPQFFFR